MSTTPDHGLRIKTPPADIDDEVPSNVYRKAFDGLQRAQKCRALGTLPYICGIVILMIAAFKLCFNVPITSEEALLTLGIFMMIYISQIVAIAILTKSELKNREMDELV